MARFMVCNSAWYESNKGRQKSDDSQQFDPLVHAFILCHIYIKGPANKDERLRSEIPLQSLSTKTAPRNAEAAD